MAKKYRSEAFAAIHETMEGLHEVGAIDKQTMREFDEACLPPVQVLAPKEIRQIRQRERISQPVFARWSSPCAFLPLAAWRPKFGR